MIASALVLSAALLLTQAPAEPAPAVPPADAPVQAAELPYEGGPVPDGYELVTEYNTQFLFYGWSIFSLAYAVAAGYGTVTGLIALSLIQRGDPFWALIPLAGPFLALGAPEFRDQVDPAFRTRHDVVMIG